MNQIELNSINLFPSTEAEATSVQKNFHTRRTDLGILIALKTLLILAVLFVLPPLSFGEPVTADQARNVVIGWLKMDSSPLQTPLSQLTGQVETFANANGTPLYYVVDLDPDGFVIVAADDLVEPIIAFAPSGHFDPSSDNPLGALVNNDLPGRIAKVKDIEATKAQGAFRTAKDKWERLKKSEQAPSGLNSAFPAFRMFGSRP